MAMYRNEGVCPVNQFLFYLVKFPEDEQKMRDPINKLLGQRTSYMVYNRKEYAWWNRNEPSIVKVLMGEKNKKDVSDSNPTLQLAYKVAEHLNRIIPECVYPDTGKKIQIHDVLSPFQISEDIYYYGDDGTERWGFCKYGYSDSNEPLLVRGNKAIFSDDRYLVVVKNKEEVVDIYILETARNLKQSEDDEELDI